MVVNIGALRGQDFTLVETEVAELRARRAGRALSKLIFEVGFLTDEEIVTLTKIGVETGVDYVKTSTGSAAFPNEAEVRLMLELMGTRSAAALVRQYADLHAAPVRAA